MASRAEKITLQVLLQSEDSIRVTPFKEGSALESTVKTSRTCPFHSRLVADRARDILGILARANAGARGLLPELQAAARAIWVDLLPGFLKEKLEEAAAGYLVLHLDRPLLGIPWELVHDGDEFLGRRFRIGRLVSAEGGAAGPLQRRLSPPLSVLVVADPSGDLPAARNEALELGEILEDAPCFGSVTMLLGDVTTRAFRDALARHDVLHYAGHVVARGGQSHLRLSDGEVSAGLLEQLRGRVDFPGLVFLNGCGSADDTLRMGSGSAGAPRPGPGGEPTEPAEAAAGMASAFLLCGVRHVVGTVWEVRDEVARRFAGDFYRSLGRGETIGDAMAAARDGLIAAHGLPSLLWADHLLYGDPTWCIAPASNLLDDDLDVLEGLTTRYRAELGSSDPGTRLVAAAMLLRLGERGAAGVLRAELPLLERWMSGDATRRERRRAGLVAAALAAAAGVARAQPDDPDALPDADELRAMLDRITPA